MSLSTITGNPFRFNSTNYLNASAGLPNKNFFVKKLKNTLTLKTHFIFNLLNWFLLVNFWSKNVINQGQKNYSVLSLTFSKNFFYFLNLNKILKKWTNSYLLLINLFFFNSNFFVLGSPAFSKETLSLNWYHSKLNFNVWRFCFPYVSLYLNKFSLKTKIFFKKIHKLGINLILVGDTSFHFRNLNYILKSNVYSLGLVDFTLSPWTFNYSLVVALIDKYSISFFYSLILISHKYAAFYKYIYYKNFFTSNLQIK
jgi:hypothetical protein